MIFVGVANSVGRVREAETDLWKARYNDACAKANVLRRSSWRAGLAVTEAGRREHSPEAVL